jgi:predicted esterase
LNLFIAVAGEGQKMDASKEPIAKLPEALVIEPTGEHTHSVILLHGMYYHGDMFEQMPRILSRLGGSAANTRWVFPCAPIRTISWPQGAEHNVSAWYNYFGSGTQIDEAHLELVTREVHAIIDAEAARLGGDTTRIALGGNSQGGTVALHAGLTYPTELGALLCGCTTLLDLTPVPQRKTPALPIFIFTAELDQEYTPPFQRRCFQRLRDAGFRVISHVEPGLDHYTTSTAELHHHAAWLSLALHGQPLTVTYRDVASAPATAMSLFG